MNKKEQMSMAQMTEELEKVAWHEKIFRDYFGLNWTAFATFSGILLSGIGLQNTLNPAAWALGALIGLALGYTFRSYISDQYASVVLLTAAIWIIIAFALLTPIDSLNNQNVAHYFIWNGAGLSDGIGTLVLAIALSMSLAFGIIAYKKRGIFDPIEIPEIFREHIKRIFDGRMIYRKNVCYRIKFGDMDNSDVTIEVKIEYELKNESQRKEKESITYSGQPGKYQIKTFDIGGQDFKDDAIRQQKSDTVSITHDVMPGKSVAVLIQVEERYPLNGNDFFTSYVPADEFSLTVETNEAFNIWGQCYCPQNMTKENKAGILVWRNSGAMLPYHGVRLYWRKQYETEDHTIT